nr:metalloregulator ArsR/SmtB family transcription factor [Flexivirga meconopsidis]
MAAGARRRASSHRGERVSAAPVFAALGDQQRLDLLDRLTEQPATATRLAAPLAISRQAVVKHLQVLQEAGLVRSTRHGRDVVYDVDAGGLQQPQDWLAAHRAAWNRRLRDLKARAEQ